MRRRSSYLKHDEEVELGIRGLTVWGYSGRGKFVCRMWVNSAGVAIFSGTTGNKRIANVTWEGLVAKLDGTKK
jgi:V8-like Glu-specific endopeptidase